MGHGFHSCVLLFSQKEYQTVGIDARLDARENVRIECQNQCQNGCQNAIKDARQNVRVYDRKCRWVI